MRQRYSSSLPFATDSTPLPDWLVALPYSDQVNAYAVMLPYLTPAEYACMQRQLPADLLRLVDRQRELGFSPFEDRTSRGQDPVKAMPPDQFGAMLDRFVPVDRDSPVSSAAPALPPAAAPSSVLRRAGVVPFSASLPPRDGDEPS